MKKLFTIKGIIAAVAVMFALSLTSCNKDDKDKTIKVTGIELTDESVTIAVGAKKSLKYEITPADATNQEVTWESDDEEVLTVDENGTITGVAEGTANITVKTKDGGYSSTCEVTVKTDTGSGEGEGEGEGGGSGEGGGKTDDSVIYAGGCVINAETKKQVATIWHNKKKIFSESNVNNDSEIKSICVTKDGVVCAGGYVTNDKGKKQAIIWKGEKAIILVDNTDVTSYVNSVKVLSDGTIYAGGSNNYRATLWSITEDDDITNDELCDGYVNSIYVDEEYGLFCVGYNGDYGFLFIDGSIVIDQLDDEAIDVFARNGADFFVSRRTNEDEGASWCVIYKDGSAILKTDELESISSIYVAEDGTVYAGGSSGNGPSLSAQLWTVNTDGTVKTKNYGKNNNIESVYVSSKGVIYAGGWVNKYPAVWSGEILEQYSISEEGRIFSIYVVE